MEDTSRDVPDECWATIFNCVDSEGDWQSLSLVCKRFLSITNLSWVSLSVFNSSTWVLSILLQRFQHLKRMRLINFPGDLSQAIHVFAKSGLDLEELDLSGNESLPKVCLEEPGQVWKISRCSTVRVHPWLMQILSRLQTFSLGSSS